jgi:excisionase family DNA binding protein
MDKPNISASEASKTLHISLATVRRLLKKGELRGYKVSDKSGWRVWTDSIEEFIQRKANVPQSADE